MDQNIFAFSNYLLLKSSTIPCYTWTIWASINSQNERLGTNTFIAVFLKIYLYYSTSKFQDLKIGSV